MNATIVFVTCIQVIFLLCVFAVVLDCQCEVSWWITSEKLSGNETHDTIPWHHTASHCPFCCCLTLLRLSVCRSIQSPSDKMLRCNGCRECTCVCVQTLTVDDVEWTLACV